MERTREQRDTNASPRRKFWREILPRIKYRNPTIPIQIARHTNADGPGNLHIFRKGAPDAAAPAHTIKVRDAQPGEILAQLVQKTGAVELQASAEETAQMDELRDFKVRSEADRVLVREKLLQERREAELLKLARGEVPAA